MNFWRWMQLTFGNWLQLTRKTPSVLGGPYESLDTAAGRREIKLIFLGVIAILYPPSWCKFFILNLDFRISKLLSRIWNVSRFLRRWIETRPPWPPSTDRHCGVNAFIFHQRPSESRLLMDSSKSISYFSCASKLQIVWTHLLNPTQGWVRFHSERRFCILYTFLKLLWAFSLFLVPIVTLGFS